MDYLESYKLWLESSVVDAKTKKELLDIKDNDQEIKERFFKDLDFGTGGLRGILGAGSNRLNVYTVGKATQGLANYILSQKLVENSVAIAHDSRRMSPEFTQCAALVLNANGIKTYVFDSLRPTPVLSFAVRELNCTAGIVITASHNPPEYNGYKVYWSDGGQVPSPRDTDIIGFVNDVSDFTMVKTMDIKEAKEKGLYNIAPPSVDDNFIENVKKQSINPDVIKATADSLKIVYTPIHGSGNVPVRRVLEEVGFKNLYIVKEQELPDGNFPTVSYPNPEDPNAFTLAIKLGKEIDADVIVGTDPDCDRVGAVVKNIKGEYEVLTGNMTGLLITDYMLSQMKEKGTLPKNPAIISTIVSTNMTKEIAKAFNTKYFEVLTGFKYIGEKIKEFEENNTNTFVFGFEESYGCLAGTYARDKDAVVATMLICELAAYYKSKNMSIYEGLQAAYKKYGYYKETIESLTLKGIEGLHNIKKIMKSLRDEPITNVNGVKVITMGDYAIDKIKNLVNGDVSPTNLPASDVLYFTLEDESWFCVRPSGTEPKIKIYFGVKEDSDESADLQLSKVVNGVMEFINNLI